MLVALYVVNSIDVVPNLSIVHCFVFASVHVLFFFSVISFYSCVCSGVLRLLIDH